MECLLLDFAGIFLQWNPLSGTLFSMLYRLNYLKNAQKKNKKDSKRRGTSDDETGKQAYQNIKTPFTFHLLESSVPEVPEVPKNQNIYRMCPLFLCQMASKK